MDYINVGAAALFIMQHLVDKGNTVAESVAEIANHVSYAEEHDLNVIYCSDCERGMMYHAAMTYYNFHGVEQVWAGGAEIDHDDGYSDRIGRLKVYRNCDIMRSAYCEERDERRMWKLVRITLKDPEDDVRG